MDTRSGPTHRPNKRLLIELGRPEFTAKPNKIFEERRDGPYEFSYSFKPNIVVFVFECRGSTRSPNLVV